MDSAAGRCWVCDAPGRLWCSGCRFALYCSLACQKKDRVRHLDECVNSSRRRVCCSYCGREEALGGVPCADCLVSSYCTDSCRKIDSKNHRPVCLTAKDKVVEAARKINEWNRRAKGIPQYLGRLIHAVDYLRWSENEGAGSQAAALTPLEATHRAKESEEKQDPRKEAWKRRSDDGRDGGGGGGREEEALRILMLGADLKHVLRTLHDTPDTCTQLLELILLDSSPHILARDLLLLYLLMVPDAPTPLQDPNLLQSHAEKVVMVFYSLALDMETHALLCNTLHNLLNMTYKTFLNELRQQIHIDAVTYTLVQAVWNGWMSFANDPAAMQKLEKVRTSKMSSKVVKDVLGRYVKSCPREHQKAISDWIKRGSLRKHKTGGNFPNVTLSCFSPLKPEYLAKFEDVSPKWSEETEWIKDVAPEDDMIYAPHGIDMIFQDWDFAMVSRNLKKEGNVIDMYLKFLTQVFAKASHKLLRSNQVTLTFIRSNVRDLAKGPLPFKGRFDRIATGIHADLLGTPFILQELGSLLRTDNIYARLLTHHRVWSLCLDWRSDQQAREMCHKSLKSNRPPDPIMMLSTRWATFRHFLQAELLHHLHVLDRRPLQTENVLPFRNVSHAYDMVMSDYTRQLNHIVPFRFRPEKRMISMVDSRLHTLEWHRIGRSRRASAPMPANPAPPPRVLPTSCHDYDPASRYVDNLITLSRNSPVPSICSFQAPDSRPGSRGCSREGSMSPCPPDHGMIRDEHQSRSRVNTRARPRSLYVPTRCKSPLLSPEFDFWEHQNLIKERRSTSAARACSEIPEGISRRVQQALQAELKQVTSRAKSAPTSPLSDSKAKVVREKASAFERGSAVRSTYPEPRRNVDPITPSTPVKKLVSMFSKAFAAKEKEADLIKPLKRSNSFHGRRRSFENDDPKKEERKDYTNSLKINRGKHADKHPEFNIVQEIGMSTFPRRTRPHSVATSNFSYLEGGIARERPYDTLDPRKLEKKEEPKKVASAHVGSSPRIKRGGHIKNFIAGLNTLTVSPVLPRANTQQKKRELRETISVMRDDLKLVNLRPGSPRLPSPVSGTPPYDSIETMDWPGNTSSRPNASAGESSDQSYSRKYVADEQKDKRGTLPREASPCSSPSLSSKLGSLRRAFKKIPQEPEYSAPPLYVTKSPTFTLQIPEQVKPEVRTLPEKFQHPEMFKMESPATVETAAPIIVTATSPIGIKRPMRPEDIFSPKSSPLQTQMHLHDLRMQQIQKSLKESETVPSKEDEKRPKNESEAVLTEPLAPPQSISIECKGTNCCPVDTFTQNIQEMVATGDRSMDDESTMSPEEFMCITSGSMSSSLTEADMEVSELFSHDESFCPIKESKSDIIDIKGAKCIEQNEEEETAVIEKEDEIAIDYGTLPESDKNNELEFDANEEKDESKQGILENSASEQKNETLSESPKQASPQVDEQCTPSVFKMVEHFAQRIQAEQQLIERPVSPKTENVLRRSRWSQIYEDSSGQSNDASVMQEDEKKVVQDCQSIEQQSSEAPEVSNDLASVQRKIAEIQTEGITVNTNNASLEANQTEDGSSEQDACDKDDKSVEIEINVPPVKPFPLETYTPKRSSSLRTTPVREISTTPVNKMVEQFAMRIKAQSLPASPRSPRPLSIGTLIQQDFLRLYSTSPTMDDKPEDEGNEETSHANSECFEETMFELSDDEEQKKPEVDVDTDKSSAAKAEPVKKESEPDFFVKMRSQKSRSRKETKRNRDSKNNELRHEFLQKIRGLTESPIPQERMKYDAIKATLAEGKKDLIESDKAFSEELASVKALASSPKLDDMTVVTYRVEVDTLPAMDEVAVSPVSASEGPASAIAVVADKECTGVDGDAQELCSTDYSKGSDDTTQLTGRNTPPPLPSGSRLPKDGRGTSSAISPNNSLKKKSVKKKVIETDVSAQRANFLKSSMGGRLDRLSFRNFVKSGISNENTTPEKPASPIKSSSYQVVEHTSSTEVSADEFKTNPCSVEEAVEAISFLTPEDKLPREKLIRKFTLYDDDTPDTGDEGITSQAPKQKVFVRRKRLQSVRSASDIGSKDASKTTSGATVAEKISNLEKKQEEFARETVESRLEKKTITGWAEARQSPQHDMKHIDEAKRTRQLEDDQETKSETSETSVDSTRDIRRFMWGSLKRKKKHSTSKTKKEEGKTNESQSFIVEDPANKALQEKNSKVSAYKFFFDRKKSKTEEESYQTVVNVESTGYDTTTTGYDTTPTSYDTTPTGYDTTPSETEPTSKGDTTPTIIAMVPKHKTKEPVQEEVSVHEEFVRCRSKTPPPETPPKPLRKSSPYREETFPAARSPRTRTKLVTERKEPSETLPPHIEEIASYTSVESLEDILSSATDTLSPNANFFDNNGEEYFECTEESSSLQDETEVFLNDTYSSTDEVSQMNFEDGVEVRPRAGVLKTSRDRSRESRRSLRVSWGDLPERMDSPVVWEKSGQQEEDVSFQREDADQMEDKTYRVTQL